MRPTNIVLGQSDIQHNYGGSGNLLSIAPTGEGRYSATCITAMCAHEGPALVLDPTGEIYRATASARERLGAKIVKLDPWGIVPDSRDGSFNPIDMFDAMGMTLSEGARFLADFIVPYHVYLPRRMELEAQDPFWPNMQRRLLLGLIILVTREAQQNEGVLSRIRTILNGDDVVYNLAVKLDTAKKGEPAVSTMDPEAYAELSSFLQLADVTRSGVIAGTNQHFGSFGNVVAQRATNTSSFDVGEWVRAENLTIYVIGPPAGVTAYDTIYRLWMGTLMTPLLQRPLTSDTGTLVILDINEAFELWPGICTAITQKRGCQVWTIVSDIADVNWAFREFYPSVLNSFSVIQALKPRNYAAATALGELFGMEGADIMKMEANEVLVMIDGRQPERLTRIDGDR